MNKLFKIINSFHKVYLIYLLTSDIIKKLMNMIK